MKKEVVIVTVLLVIVVIGLIVISGLFNSNGNVQGIDYCEVRDDCAPAVCCHPESAVNKQYGPDCSDVFCTQVCQGPLDCGAGRIECLNNKCVIVAN